MTEIRPIIKITLTKAGPRVDITHFEHLSPGKIEKCFDAALKEWYRLRARAIGERRKLEAAERAGAENG